MGPLLALLGFLSLESASGLCGWEDICAPTTTPLPNAPLQPT